MVRFIDATGCVLIVVLLQQKDKTEAGKKEKREKKRKLNKKKKQRKRKSLQVTVVFKALVEVFFHFFLGFVLCKSFENMTTL